MSRQLADYYALLGVARGASAADLGRAYRRAARATHPDVHPDDAAAAERFHAVTIAYETLSDPQRRASYDRTHPRFRPHRPVHVAVHQPVRVAPVHLGTRRPQPEPLQPFRASPAATPGAANLFELVMALSRLIDRGPIP